MESIISNEDLSGEEMSSHDLTAEEESHDRALQKYTDSNEQDRLASQRDREAQLNQLRQQHQQHSDSSGDEVPCSEIRMDFFSPTKL